MIHVLCHSSVFCAVSHCKKVYVRFLIYRGRFIMLSGITNIYNKKSKGPTLMELFTATGKLKTLYIYIYIYRCSMCAPRVTRHTSIRYSSCYHTRVNMLTRVNILSMCGVSPVVHTSNISSCQKKLFQFSCGSEQFQ